MLWLKSRIPYHYITYMKKDRPAHAASNLISPFWYDTTRHSENSPNVVSDAVMVAEDICELIIGNDENLNEIELNTAEDNPEPTIDNDVKLSNVRRDLTNFQDMASDFSSCRRIHT